MKRSCLVWLGLLSVILAGCKLCFEGGVESQPKVSVFAHYIRGIARQRGLTPDEASEKLYSLGVRGFDAAYTDKDLPELAKTCLKPVNLYGIVRFLEADGGDAAVKRFVSVAEKYAVPRIMVIPDSFTKGGDEVGEFGRIVEGMRKMVALAKSRGIVVMIEDFGGDPMNPCSRLECLKRFLAEIPDLRLALDSGNLYYARRGDDILELMVAADGRIEHVHLKDQIEADHRTYAPLGLGGVPNAQIVKRMAGSGYKGWYTLENTVVGADIYTETARQMAVLKVWCEK